MNHFTRLICIAVTGLLFACSNGDDGTPKPGETNASAAKTKRGSPSATVEGYLTAMATYDFLAAFDYTVIRDEVRAKSAEEMSEATMEMKAGIDAEDGIAEFRVLHEQINGDTATVEVETTMGNGRTTTESITLVKQDGLWLLN